MRSRRLTLVIGLIVLSAAIAKAQPAATLGMPAPAARLGMPAAAPAQPSVRQTARGVSPDPLIGDYIPAARLGPISEVRFGPDTPETPATPEERYNWGLRDPFQQAQALSPAPAPGGPVASQSQFGGKFKEMLDGQAPDWGSFKSDHCFDDFISPVSNPFLNEDPRALTELRPIFMYQTIPSNNPGYHGGNIEWFGIQARLAVTQRFSIVLNKLGGIWLNPGSGSPLQGGSAFSEIWLSPKYTWYRDDQSQTLSAVGLIFQIPGQNNIYQSTPGLSLVPYVNFAQKIGKTSYGSFNIMDNLGFAFSTTQQRSSYVYDSFHVDFDVANYNKIFPLIELNWFHYFKNGNRPYDFEGTDLANVGSFNANGIDLMTIAFGARYKYTESFQAGLAASFPLWHSGGNLQNFRLTVDVIWRY